MSGLFKKFNIKEDVSTRSLVKSSVQRNIRSKILEQYPSLQEYFEELLPKKGNVIVLKCPEHVSVVTHENELLFFQQRDGPFYPSLKILHQFPDILPKFRVDKGAIKFVLSGANIMCPGLTHPNAVMEADVPKGTVVAVYAEGMEHALAVGLAVMSTQEIKKINKGIGVENIHYLNDGLWKAHMD